MLVTGGTDGTPTADGGFTEHLSSVRDALTQLTALVGDKPAPKPEEKREPPDALAGLTDTLDALNTSFRTLTETVREQQQRLARVEKHAGLPNSAQSPETAPVVEPDDVGWPMDLNHPVDRESVDKAVSFHDL